MLLLPADLLETVVARSVDAWSHEVCGILAGPSGPCRPGGCAPTRHLPIRNAAEDPRGEYLFDPVEQMQAYAEMDVRGEDPVVVYHSHPTGPATPSPKDIAGAAGGDVHWLIVSVTGKVDVRSWRITNGAAVEEKIQVVGRRDHRPVTDAQQH